MKATTVKGMKKFFRVTGSAIAAIMVVLGCGKDNEVGNQQISWEDANNRPYRGAISATTTKAPTATPAPYAMQIYDSTIAQVPPSPAPYAMQIYDSGK